MAEHRLPTPLLTGVIEPGDYPDWATARRFMATPADREVLKDLRASLPVQGQLEPLTLGVWRSDLTVYISDGHHRALVLTELGVLTFTYRWFWKSRGQDFSLKRCEREPIPEWVLEGRKTHG